MFTDQTIARSCQQPSEDDQQPICTDIIDFFIRGKIYKNVSARLYQNQIILAFKIQQQIFYKRIDFHFDILFHLISSKNLSKKQYQPNSNSIKFEKKQNYLELRNITNFNIWKTHLLKKLNQRGFHQQFRPIKELGEGSFAVVYLAMNNENGKHYAIKAFNKGSVYSEQHGKESLIKEITIMRSLNHKNLLKIYGVFQSINSIYVCVELLKGGHLQDSIMQNRMLNALEIRAIMKNILEGLEYLHSHNIMHRDIKPQNILFRKEEGRDELDCVIADFGLAERTDSKKWIFNKCGTPGYVAPEIINIKHSHQRYDTACDMFSLGVIFHMLILHKSPFSAKNQSQIVQQNKSCKFNFQNWEYNSLPSTWLSLLKALLEKDPKKRITASQALHHDFFKKEPLVGKFSTKAKSKSNNKIILLNFSQEDTIAHNIDYKPLVLSRNNSQIKSGLLKNNSTSKLKLTLKNTIGPVGKQNGLPIINSALRDKSRTKPCENRFKQLIGSNS